MLTPNGFQRLARRSDRASAPVPKELPCEGSGFAGASRVASTVVFKFVQTLHVRGRKLRVGGARNRECHGRCPTLPHKRSGMHLGKRTVRACLSWESVACRTIWSGLRPLMKASG
jgi:hypothetical protein